jgi:hypothetical protein
LYDYLRYNNAKKELVKIRNHFMHNCKKSLNIKNNSYNELSKNQKSFLKNLSVYIDCNQLPYLLNTKMYNIFCLNSKEINQSKQLRKLSYRFKSYYCVSDIFIVIEFIDKQYHEYINSNKVLNFKSFNTSLFGKEHIDDDELLNMILSMTLKEFIIAFSPLNIDANGYGDNNNHKSHQI